MSDDAATSTADARATTDMTVRTTKWRFWYFLLGYPWWRAKRWTATGHDLVCEQGVFSRNEKRVAWSRIQDKSVKQGLLGRIFNTGSITLADASEKTGSTVLKSVGDVERFYDEICRRCDAAG